MLTEKQLDPLDIERYKVAHEQWFARMPNIDHLIKKPFGNPRECVETFRDKPGDFDPRTPGKPFMAAYAEYITHKNQKLGSAGQLERVRAALAGQPA